ncbi:MAG: N-formylglutamate deformylase [Polyangiales bacterium]
MSDFLELQRGELPLIVSFPHTGTDLPPAIETQLASAWLARQDADHFIHRLYDFAHGLGATTLRTTVSRSVIDVNRDPSGASLYPGQNTTELCPTTTFDGEPLYPEGRLPDAREIAQRRATYFAPYHAALAAEITRLRADHAQVVLFDAHAIRSRVPRLFDGLLPELNLGTHDGRSCSLQLQHVLEQLCAATPFSRVTNGRFKGGWTTRHYGQPALGVHVVQLELAMRAFLDEPTLPPSAANWPPPYDVARAAPLRQLLERLLRACITFALSPLGAFP